VCINAATPLHPAVLPQHNVTRQYVKHQSSLPRSVSGDASEVGAFEAAAPIAIPAVSHWTAAVLGLLLLVAGTLAARKA
jgi:hypothetical protein